MGLLNWFRKKPETRAGSQINLTWETALGLNGATTEAGISVTPHTALNYPPVFQAISLISGDTAKLPFEVFRRDGEFRVKATSHPAYPLVRRRANPETSAYVFWRRFVMHALLWGNGYALIERDPVTGNPVNLYNLLPDRTSCEHEDTPVGPMLVYTSEINGHPETFMPREILHLQGVGYNCLDGEDVTAHLRDAWSVGIAQENFAAKFYKNGAKIAGVLEVPTSMSKKGKDVLQEGVDKLTSKDNWFKTMILRENAKFHRVGVDPQAGQLAETHENVVRQVARSFNLPPSKLGVADSQSYNSQAEANRAYLDSTLGVWLEAIASECWMKLLKPSQQRRDTHFFEHNTNALLRLNVKDRFDAYAIAIDKQIFTPNEIRAKENEAPREGGDAVVSLPGAKAEPEPAGDPDEARAVFEISMRARHKAKKPNAFIEFVDALEDSALKRSLSQAASEHSAAELSAAVDRITRQFETGALGA